MHQVGSVVDDLMARAARATASTDYFEAEALCLRALYKARRANDFERMARIVLPLQEARRQRRHEACDAGFAGFFGALPRGRDFRPGLYLLQPPLVGIDAGNLRDTARRLKVPIFVLVKEPTTSQGRWPIVGVGGGQREPVVVRVQVAPPAGDLPDASWFLATQEALGDTAIAKVRRDWPADHRVDDFLEYLEAVPDHEKLMQALEHACREAATTGVSPVPRRRALIDDPFSF